MCDKSDATAEELALSKALLDTIGGKMVPHWAGVHVERARLVLRQLDKAGWKLALAAEIRETKD